VKAKLLITSSSDCFTV